MLSSARAGDPSGTQGGTGGGEITLIVARRALYGGREKELAHWDMRRYAFRYRGVPHALGFARARAQRLAV